MPGDQKIENKFHNMNDYFTITWDNFSHFNKFKSSDYFSHSLAIVESTQKPKKRALDLWRPEKVFSSPLS